MSVLPGLGHRIGSEHRPAGRGAPSLAAVAVAALIPALLVGGWLLADAVQPVAYSPVRETVSVTAGYGGRDRWIMTGALMLIGAGYLVLALDLRELRARARFGLLVAGLAALGIAACPEPATGGTGQHAASTAVGAVAIAVWPALAARGRSGPLVTSARWCALATTAFLGLLVWLAVQTRGGHDLGLAERISSSVQVAWPLVVTIGLRMSEP